MARDSYRILLSWDPKSGVTSGFFNHENSNYDGNTLLLYLRGLGVQARHPISIITAILDQHTRSFRNDVILAMSRVHDVERSLDLIPSNPVRNDCSPQPQLDYSVAHARLVDAFTISTSHDYSFVPLQRLLLHRFSKLYLYHRGSKIGAP